MPNKHNSYNVAFILFQMVFLYLILTMSHPISDSISQYRTPTDAIHMLQDDQEFIHHVPDREQYRWRNSPDGWWESKISLLCGYWMLNPRMSGILSIKSPCTWITSKVAFAGSIIIDFGPLHWQVHYNLTSWTGQRDSLREDRKTLIVIMECNQRMFLGKSLSIG